MGHPETIVQSDANGIGRKKRDMFLNKDRLLIISSSVMAALLFSFSWAGAALADGGVEDGDGIDGNDLLWPLLMIGGLLITGVITFFVWQRRSRSQSQEPKQERGADNIMVSHTAFVHPDDREHESRLDPN